MNRKPAENSKMGWMHAAAFLVAGAGTFIALDSPDLPKALGASHEGSNSSPVLGLQKADAMRMSFGELLNLVDIRGANYGQTGLAALLGRLPDEKLEEFIQQTVGQLGEASSISHELLVLELGDALFKSNPERCLALLLTLDGSHATLLMNGIRRSFARDQADLATTLISGLLNEKAAVEPEREAQLRALLHLGDIDRFTQVLTEGDIQNDRALQIAFHWYTEDHPKEVRRIFESYVLNVERYHHAMPFVSLWVSSDPKSAMAWIGEQPPEIQEHATQQALRGLLNQGRFLEVLPFLDQIKEVPIPVELLAMAAEELGFWKGPDAGLAWLKNAPSSSEEDIRQFVSRMTYRDPFWVVEHSAELPPLHDGDVQLVIAALLEVDSTRAIEWAVELEGDEKVSIALQRIFGSLASSDPDEAIKAFNELSADHQTTSVLNTIAAALGEENWEHAEAFARLNASSEDELAALLTTALKAGVRTGSSVAAEEMTEFLIEHPDDPSAGDAAQTLVRYEIWNNHPALVERVQSLPAGSVRDQAVELLAREWANRDPVATSEWMATQPDVPDNAIVALTREIRGDLEASLGWASHISDRNLQLTVVQELLSDPMMGDADHTIRLLNQSSIDPILIKEALAGDLGQ